MRWRLLFSDRFSLLTIVAILGLLLATASLGNWQIRRAHEKQLLGEFRDQALAGAGIDITARVLDPQIVDGQKGRVSGRFVPAGTIFLDNRTFKGTAGFYVLTPLAPEAGGPSLLILRGWVARDAQDRTRLPTFETPTGLVSVDGLFNARLPQSLQLNQPGTPSPSEKIWQYFDLDVYSRWFGGPVHPYVLRQMSAMDDRLIREWIHPADAVDKHRAYALQWYSMTAGIAFFGLFAAFRVIKSRSTKSRSKEIV